MLAVREVTAGERIAADLGGSTEVRALDLADLRSVRRFAESWDGDLDVLINNAGVGNLRERRVTADGEVRGRPTLVGRTTQAADPDLARGLWTLSEKLTGVAFPLRAAA